MRQTLFRFLACVALTLWALPMAHAQTSPTPTRVELWSQVTILSDPSHKMGWQEVAAQAKRFEVPSGPYANLGPRSDTVWLHIPLQTPAADGPWWLAIDYPPLDVAELHLLAEGKLVQRVLMGDHLLMSERPAPTSMHVAPLTLEPGRSYELLIRVRSASASALIVPAVLFNTPALIQHQSLVEMLQGLALGFGLCMICFTAARALITREWMYAWFTLACISGTLFFPAYFGVATQYLWPESRWLTQNAPAWLMLLMLSFGTLFVVRSLDIPRYSRFSGWAMHGVAGVSLLAALLFVLGAMDYKQASQVSALFGMLPMLLALPVAYKRAREGDRAAIWTFIGWGVYGVGVASMVMLSAGRLGAWGWAQGLYQVAAILETIAWMMVLGVRADEMRLAAEHAKREHARVLQISQTDPLTGLLNRRGLQLGLPPLVLGANPNSLTAVYLLDLDGFKPINDSHGHDAGDELLTQMGARLKQAVRGGDLVARLGGDEFVVVASQLRGEAEAEQVGQKLLACSNTLFSLAHVKCRVGMTVGYAIAPFDGHDGDALLRRADAAMYGGKQAGKNRVRRASEALATA